MFIELLRHREADGAGHSGLPKEKAASEGGFVDVLRGGVFTGRLALGRLADLRRGLRLRQEVQRMALVLR